MRTLFPQPQCPTLYMMTDTVYMYSHSHTPAYTELSPTKTLSTCEREYTMFTKNTFKWKFVPKCMSLPVVCVCVCVSCSPSSYVKHAVQNQIFVGFCGSIFLSYTQCFVWFLPSSIILKSTSSQLMVDGTDRTHACTVLIHSCYLISYHWKDIWVTGGIEISKPNERIQLFYGVVLVLLGWI